MAKNRFWAAFTRGIMGQSICDARDLQFMDDGQLAEWRFALSTLMNPTSVT